MIFPNRGAWRGSEEICTYVNDLSEELVNEEQLISDSNPEIRVLGRMLQAYQELLQEGNLLDFAAIQTECYRLLAEHPEILQELRDKINI